ncbi:MAG: hypothetical protein RLN76_07275 [Phycisphaeraceae bacterium]
MNFSQDRDLLAYEPNVFVEVPFTAQERVSVADGLVSGNTLTSVEADFVTAGVEVGGVVLIERVAHEVLAVIDAGTLSMSAVRGREADAAIAAKAGEQLSVRVRTFAPQATLVHDLLLRLLGLSEEDSLGEEAVVSLGAMMRLECLGTLEMVYSAAASISGHHEAVLAKAALYRERFRRACREAVIGVDLDGDGRANERRRLGLVSLVRS